MSEPLLLVTFGSTYEGPHKTFATLRNAFAESFPDRDIYMAFTSKFCIRKWLEKTGEEYYTTDKWLEAIGEAGYKAVSIQSLHVIPGLEYSFIDDRYIPQFHRLYPQIPTTVGVPLLWSQADIERVGDCIYSLFRERLSEGKRSSSWDMATIQISIPKPMVAIAAYMTTYRGAARVYSSGR